MTGTSGGLVAPRRRGGLRRPAAPLRHRQRLAAPARAAGADRAALRLHGRGAGVAEDAPGVSRDRDVGRAENGAPDGQGVKPRAWGWWVLEGSWFLNVFDGFWRLQVRTYTLQKG